jgi:hypothetical protein
MEEFAADEVYPDEISALTPKRGMSGWLVALLVVLGLASVCIVCLCLALWLAGPAVGNTFSTIVETVEATPPHSLEMCLPGHS